MPRARASEKLYMLKGRRRLFGQPWIALACAGLLVLASMAEARDKTDQVVLKNGDFLTGEIKGMEAGRLSFKTDTMETVSIKWTKVSLLRSSCSFQIETADGLRHLGTLGDTYGEDILLVRGEDVSISLPIDQVVRMAPIESYFRERFSGSVSVGFSYTKGSDLTQFSINGNTRYRTDKNILDLSASSILTVQGKGDTKERDDVGLIYTRLLPKKWFLLAASSLQRNDELGIERRLILGGGGGRYIVQTNRAELSALTGFVMNQEWIAGTGPTNELNAEGLAGLIFSVFIYDTPKMTLSTKVLTFTGLTNTGRFRVEYDISLRKEIVKDLFIEPSGYVSYDNEPPSEGSAETDYGLVTSLGYSF